MTWHDFTDLATLCGNTRHKSATNQHAESHILIISCELCEVDNCRLELLLQAEAFVASVWMYKKQHRSDGLDTQWGRKFSDPSRPALRPIHSPVQWVTGLFSRGKRLGCGASHPPPPSARVENGNKIYLYLPSVPFVFNGTDQTMN